MPSNYPDVIVPLAHKGGVGKSLTLRLLYQSLARVLRKNGENRKILLVDIDPQANTSSRWLPMEVETQGKVRGRLPPVHPELEGGDRSDVTDIWLRGEAPEPYPTANPLIDIVPARTFNIKAVKNNQSHLYHSQGIYAWLSDPLISETYCAVFIDTPPSTEEDTQAGAAAASACYIPLEYEPYPVDGMDQMIHLVDAEKMSRSPDHPLQFLGVIGNKVPTNRAAIYRDYREALRNHPTYGPYMMDCEIRDLAAFAETDAKTTIPGDIFDYPSKTHAHVMRESQAFCESVFRSMPSFQDWDLDFRSGDSFEPDNED